MDPIPDLSPVAVPVTNPVIVDMEEGPAVTPKGKLGIALDVAAILRDMGDLITEFKDSVSARKILGATSIINALAVPIALSNVTSQAGTLIKGGPREDISLATVGLAGALGSSASSISSTATGFYIIADASKGAWVSTLGSIATVLGVFGIAASGLGYYFTERVTDKIDSVLRDKGPDRLAKIEGYLLELKEKENGYLSRHFNLRSGGAEKVKELIEKALEGSHQKKVDLVATLEGRAIKKKNADARDLIIGAFAFMILLTLSLSPIGWLTYAVGIVAALLYLANLAYRIRASGEPLVQKEPRVENEHPPTRSRITVNPNESSVG